MRWARRTAGRALSGRPDLAAAGALAQIAASHGAAEQFLRSLRRVLGSYRPDLALFEQMLGREASWGWR